MEAPKKKKTIKNKTPKKKVVDNGGTVTKGKQPVNKLETQKDIPENDANYMREFELYAIWKSLPPILKGETPADLEKKYFIDDEVIIELLQIRTQRQFADHFKLHENTTTRWNSRLKERDLFADIREWTNKLLKNVMLSTYRVAMSKDPKANADRKLFMQFGGWGEEMTVHTKGESLADIIKRDLDIK